MEHFAELPGTAGRKPLPDCGPKGRTETSDLIDGREVAPDDEAEPMPNVCNIPR